MTELKHDSARARDILKFLEKVLTHCERCKKCSHELFLISKHTERYEGKFEGIGEIIED
jgi:hypothetical protein